MAAAWLVPGASIEGFWGALLVSAIVAALNAVLPPLLAALKLPFTLVAGFLLVLLADALMLLAADEITDNAIHLDSFWIALLVALVASAVIVVLEVITGSNDDDTYTIRVIQRLARRSGERVESDRAGNRLSSRSTASRSPSSAARCGTGTRRTWRAGWPSTATRSRSGSPTSRPRRERARRGSCSAPTRTSRPSAGSRRRPAS